MLFVVWCAAFWVMAAYGVFWAVQLVRLFWSASTGNPRRIIFPGVPAQVRRAVHFAGLTGTAIFGGGLFLLLVVWAPSF